MLRGRRRSAKHGRGVWSSAERRTASVSRTLPSIDLATAFFEARGVTLLVEVSPDDAAGFVASRLTSGLPASVATQHNRRAALRRLFRVARRHGYVGVDPTVDVVLPPKSNLPTRPLDDLEIDLCRDVAWWMPSRVAAAWALAEATGRGAEVALVRPEDVDLDVGLVYLRGGARTEPRTALLTEWGVTALRRRSSEVGRAPIAYGGSGRGIAGQVSTCRAISSVLLRAGLAGEPDVRPASAAAWAGRRTFDVTGRIEDAARVMGVRSLDRAARLIGVSWTDR